MTKYEKAIYDIIQASCEHLTAQEVYDILRTAYPQVVLATVYNNLNKLWEAGLIRKVVVEGSPDRFDNTKKHDHLVCKRCGAIADVNLKDLSASLHEQLEELGEDFLSYDLKVYYLCPACRGKA